MAYIISILQDSDGLTRAIQGRNKKYLMNNCESYGGINAFIKLSKRFHWNHIAYYEEVRKSIKKGILEQFYDENKKNFYWAVDGEGKHPSHWTRYYPDAFAQLFPIFHRVLEENSELKENLWKCFLKYYQNARDHVSIEQKLIYELTQDVISKGEPTGTETE